MVTGFIIIAAMFLVLAGTGPLMVMAFHRYVRTRYYLPGISELVLQMVGRTDDESSVDVLMKRVRRLMPDFSIRSLNPGSKHIYRVHVIVLAPQDFDIIAASIGLLVFCQDYADAYGDASHVTNGGQSPRT